jgi:hypothetical protein
MSLPLPGTLLQASRHSVHHQNRSAFDMVKTGDSELSRLAPCVFYHSHRSAATGSILVARRAGR